MAAQKKYPDELRERAVKMLFEVREREGKGRGELARVARQLGVHPEALRFWAKQAEIDGGVRPGTTTDDKQRIAELEKENRELRRAPSPALRSPSAAGPAPPAHPHSKRHYRRRGAAYPHSPSYPRCPR
jgi:transposase